MSNVTVELDLKWTFEFPNSVSPEDTISDEKFLDNVVEDLGLDNRAVTIHRREVNSEFDWSDDG